MISSLHAAILGVVEGLTEFLPVSSTGHMILTSHWLGLGYGEGINAFEVVIQSGALLAVVGLYFPAVASMVRGLLGFTGNTLRSACGYFGYDPKKVPIKTADPEGFKLLFNLLVAFMPAAVVGLLAESKIKTYLFGAWPVVFALAAGGVAMLLVERFHDHRAPKGAPGMPSPGRSIARMTWRTALVIGCAQCLAMWPGTSRSMVTILAAILLGYSPRDAAKFSFLLALPTLGAATAYDFYKDGHAILEATRVSGLAIGFVVSFVVAWVAVKGFIVFLTRHGMAIFGWYRLVIAGVMAVALLSQVTLTGTIHAAPAAAAKPETAATAVSIETPAGLTAAIYPNPVGAELAALAGHRVKISGSFEKNGGTAPRTIKVLSYRDLDKKKKDIKP